MWTLFILSVALGMPVLLFMGVVLVFAVIGAEHESISLLIRPPADGPRDPTGEEVAAAHSAAGLTHGLR